MTLRPHEQRVRPGWVLIALPLMLAATVFVRALDGASFQDGPKADGAADPAKAGEELTTKICTECHEFDQVVAVRRTPREWKDMMTTMVNKGANASPAEFAAVRTYLIRYWGTVPVNTAPAADLSAVLGLSAKEAEALVAYRTTHGKLTDLDALAKALGVEKSKLDELAEAIRFD